MLRDSDYLVVGTLGLFAGAAFGTWCRRNGAAPAFLHLGLLVMVAMQVLTLIAVAAWRAYL